MNKVMLNHWTSRLANRPAVRLACKHGLPC